MGRRVKAAGLAALAVLALVAGALVGRSGDDPSSTPPGAPRPPVVTIVQDDAELLHRSDDRTAATLDDLAAAGVDWVRVTAGWSVIAPAAHATRAPEGFDGADPAAYPRGAWAPLDRVARMARARGLRLAVDIAFWAPRWAVDEPVDDPARQRSGIDPALFADFAQAVARRYPGAAAFTVWNEPNHPVFLLPQFSAAGEPVSPHRYRAMLRAAVPRIRAAAPEAKVLIGATSSIGAAEPDEARDRMSPLAFARALACVDERLRALDVPACEGFAPLPGDGWSHHPYSLRLPPWAPSPEPGDVRMGDLDRLGDLLDALHTAGRTRERLGLWLTEFGYQTNPPDPTWETTPARAARWLAEAERIARADERVHSTAHFLVRDLPRRPGDTLRERWRDYQTGLRFEDGRAKPTLAALELPLVVRRAGPGRVALWGLVRPGRGARPYRVLARAPGGETWRTVHEGSTRPDGTFGAEAAADPAHHFLLEARTSGAWRRGAPLQGAGGGP